MTTTVTRSRIAAMNVERITSELEAAQEDVALLERLKSAQDRETRLTAELAKAIKERDKAVAADAKEAKSARFAGISDVQVTEHPDTIRDHVLRASFTIHWSRPTWDGRTNAPAKHSITGFGACPPEVLEYLIERCPERIPSKIMALAPDHPREAFMVYFRGLKRGCFVG